jgi:DNA-binding IclR family transcriptional regulator
VYFLLDALAGKSGNAKYTIAEFAKRTKMGRNGAAEAFHELEDAGWIREPRRGTWKVINPCRHTYPSRSGEPR